jgi:hypothetical protein
MAGDLTLVATIRARRPFLLVPVAVLAWAVVDVARGDAHRYATRPRRTAAGQTATELVGTFIRQRTQPTDTIFVWGWSGWPVYYWAQRRSPGRVYKSLGTLTTFNGNTAFNAGGPVAFRPGPAAIEFLADFDRRPPAYVVVASGSRAMDPLIDFVALEQRLQRDYTALKRFDDLLILRRNTP